MFYLYRYIFLIQHIIAFTSSALTYFADILILSSWSCLFSFAEHFVTLKLLFK